MTGIGGGVALMFACARDCNVFVTSSSSEKLEMANGLGAAGDVNHKQEG
jgi:D-arabinose 1-dehydrogenase-like Zn-dependent alcohol dehydrogenase